MNERIKELAEQATSTLSVNHEGYRGSKGYIEQVEYFDKEKFAELIVRESIDILEHRYKWDGDVTEGKETKMCIARIKQHFGVKE